VVGRWGKNPFWVVFWKVLNFSFFRYELKKSSSAKCVVSGSGVDWDTAAPSCESKRGKTLHRAIKIIIGTALV